MKEGYDNSAEASTTFTVAARDVDADDDGLIDIYNLDMLNNIRYNLAGTSYKTSADDLGSSAGAPASRPFNCIGRTTTSNLCGYELMQDLDFTVAAHYASGTVNRDWRPNNADPDRARNAGFPGLGAETNILEESPLPLRIINSFDTDI